MNDPAWIGEGCRDGRHLSRDKDTGKFAHRDAVTMADICVVGQVTGRVFNVDVAPIRQ